MYISLVKLHMIKKSSKLSSSKRMTIRTTIEKKKLKF